MTPLTLMAPQTVAILLTTGNALDTELAAMAENLGYTLPGIPATQIILSSADADITDRRQGDQLSEDRYLRGSCCQQRQGEIQDTLRIGISHRSDRGKRGFGRAGGTMAAFLHRGGYERLETEHG